MSGPNQRRQRKHRHGTVPHDPPRRSSRGRARLIAGAAQRYGAIPGSPEAGHLAALKTLWQLAYREASTLAYADAFRAIMLAFIVATLLVPLLRNVAVSPASASASH